MEEESSRFIKGAKSRWQNGKINGRANGSSPKVKSNGHVVTATAPSRRPSTTTKMLKKTPSILSIIARILTWYSIVTVLYRCPADIGSCDEASPAICAPYLRARDAVGPHLTPYYDSYAAPYVEVARPYYDAVRTRVVDPAQAYAGPRMAQARDLGLRQWDRTVAPRLDRVRALALHKYEETAAPHVRRASAAIAPYAEMARLGAGLVYHQTVLPAYERVRPHAARGYGAAADYATGTAAPAAIRAWLRLRAFLDGTVWPRVRMLYVENVEPQLVRIGERLGRHKHREEAQNVHGNGDHLSPLKMPTAAAKLDEAPQQPTETSPPAAAESESPAEPESGRRDPALEDEDFANDPRPVREIVADDLHKWEAKYTHAAEEGVVAIVDLIDEISDRMLETEVNKTGRALLARLQSSVDSELAALRSEIVKIAAESATAGRPDREGAADRVAAAARKAGLALKDRAQRVRAWRERFDLDLQTAINTAAQSHVQILDQISDLALQRIGIKWAWMDGVTYKDWQKYHELRGRLTGWTEEIKGLLVSHPGIASAQSAAADVEDAAMEVAQAAARELASLKQIGVWKVASGDASDSLDPAQMEAAAAAADTDSKYAGPGLRDDESDGSSDGSGSDGTNSASDEGDDNAAETVTLQEAATVVVDLSQVDNPTDEPAHSEFQEAPHDSANLAQVPSDVLMGRLPDMVSATDRQEEQQHMDQHGGVSDTTEPVKAALFGAAAQTVSGRGPILDDESDMMAAITAAYSSAVAMAAAQYSTATSVVSAQMYGTPKPVHEQLLSGVSSGYSAALASASAQLSNAADAASKGIYGTPTGQGILALPTGVDWAQVEAVAADRLNEGRVWAEMQYSSAKVALGMASPTPTAPVDKLLEGAKYNYYAGLGIAQVRYSEFLAAASAAVGSLAAASTPATPTNLVGSASSMASAASVAGESVASAAASAVSESWDSVFSRVSAQVYGEPTPTPWYGPAYDEVIPYAAAASAEAEKQYSAVRDLVAELVQGREPTFSESIMSRLGGVYGTATAKVGSVASEIGEAFAEGTQQARREKDEL